MKRKLVVSVVAGLAISVVAVAVAKRRPPVPKPQQARFVARTASEPRDREPTVAPVDRPAVEARHEQGEVLPPKETARKMDEAALRGLVQNLKLAALREQTAIRESIVKNLKRRGPKAREILAQEMAVETNPHVVSALEAAIKEMP